MEISSLSDRQGDPLSPYLFVLCMEKLCQIITCRVNCKDWKGIRMSRGGPLISNVFFANDLILFLEAMQSQAHIFKECLDVFCAISGQKVSLEKSALHCSANVNHNVTVEIAKIIGFSRGDDLGTYVGVPLIHSRASPKYKHILEKMKQRLAGRVGTYL